MADSALYIGLMSGTSVDSVDVALVDFAEKPAKLIAFHNHPIPQTLRDQLLLCNQTPELSLNKLCQLQVETAKIFAEAALAILKNTPYQACDISAIGSHGQTIYHAPEIGMSLQIGHPAYIAKLTGIRTAADFRIDDMALGGEGAPFAPAFHQYLFAEEQRQVVAVNIGGIANISILPSHQQNELLGFDSGPGNGLMDEICQHDYHKNYDKKGKLAASGKVDRKLLQKLLDDSYFNRPAPKSTGRDHFNTAWLEKKLATLKNKPDSADLLATLAELTAITIADGILAHIPNSPDVVWICGGGALNKNLIKRLKHHLPNSRVKSSAKIDIDPNQIEAMLFAWLAERRLAQKKVKLKKVTGATHNAILGGIWEP